MNLVETAALTKKIINLTIIFLIVYVLILLVKNPVVGTFKAIFPPKDLPTLTLGQLDTLEFTEVQILTQNPRYTLNTRTGGLPTNIPKNMIVYKYDLPSFSYSAGRDAQEHARLLGFSDDMLVSNLSSSVFTWQDLSFGGALTIDTQSRTIALDTPLAGKGALFPAGKISRIKAIEVAKELLTDIARFDDPLYSSETLGEQVVTFGKFGTGGLIKADSTLEAQVAKVEFFRKINEFSIVGQSPFASLIQVVLRDPSVKDFPQLAFPYIRINHWKVNPISDATYQLIPVQTAWEQVSTNNGIIAGVIPNGANPFAPYSPVNVENILINEIYVAYYDSPKPQRYMQPIYVFEGNYTSSTGNGQIAIYYPAVNNNYQE